jgi:hypothetical protein
LTEKYFARRRRKKVPGENFPIKERKGLATKRHKGRKVEKIRLSTLTFHF